MFWQHIHFSKIFRVKLIHHGSLLLMFPAILSYIFAIPLIRPGLRNPISKTLINIIILIYYWNDT